MPQDNTNAQRSSSQPASTNTSPRQSHSGRDVNAASDRERPIESGRETERTGRNRGGLARSNRTGTSSGDNPFALMQRMAEDMDQLFEQFGFGGMGLGRGSRFGSMLGGDPWSGNGASAQDAMWSPQVETFRRGDNIVIRADVPGVNKDDIHVDVENDVLTISGERRAENEDQHEGYYRTERSYGQFYRAIPLPEGVDTDQCNASFKDGVLEVTLPAPRDTARGTRRIPVK